MTRRKGNELSHGGLLSSPRWGFTSRAEKAWSTPLPKCFSSPFLAVENRALRTASTRRQSRGSSFLYFSIHIAAAAATCGVAAEVPSPFRRTVFGQPNRAQGMFGV